MDLVSSPDVFHTAVRVLRSVIFILQLAFQQLLKVIYQMMKISHLYILSTLFLAGCLPSMAGFVPGKVRYLVVY
jgi:hypothetical protein